MPEKRKAASPAKSGGAVATVTSSSSADASSPKKTKISAATSSAGAAAPSPTNLKGKQAIDEINKMVKQKVIDSGRSLCLLQGLPDPDYKDPDGEATDSDDDNGELEKELTYAELLKLLKYLLFTKVQLDAFEDASRSVEEVMCGDRYEHPMFMVQAIHDGSYTRPTREEAMQWCGGFGNSSSSHAYWAIFEREIRLIRQMLRKSRENFPAALGALLGLTTSAFENDLWLLDVEDFEPSISAVNAFASAWRAVLKATNEQLDISEEDRQALHWYLDSQKKSLADYNTYGCGKLTFNWAPPKKRAKRTVHVTATVVRPGSGDASQPQVTAFFAKAARASPKTSAGATAAAAGSAVAPRPNSPYSKIRDSTAPRNILQLRVTPVGQAPSSKTSVEVCVFDTYTFMNLHRALVQSIFSTARGPSAEALNSTKYTFSHPSETTVGTARTADVKRNGRSVLLSAMDWSHDVTYSLLNGTDNPSFIVSCVDAAPQISEKQLLAGSSVAGEGVAFKDADMPRCVSHFKGVATGCTNANVKLLKMRFNPNQALNKKPREIRVWLLAGTKAGWLREQSRALAEIDIKAARSGK